jgi:tRNA-Thr(GGU) m(6)t(6)A37 methyltransferase TsaA
MRSKIELKPIGMVHSPIKESDIKYIQKPEGNGIQGELEVFPEYALGLTDVEGLNYVIVLFHFHLSDKEKLMSGPGAEANKHGVFATRSPNRPNHIGMSVVKVLGVEGNRVKIDNCDMMNGTPIIDIKPFVADIDAAETQNSGWLKDIDRSQWKNS